MKQLFLFGAGFLLAALLATVLVWYMLQNTLGDSTKASKDVSEFHTNTSVSSTPETYDESEPITDEGKSTDASTESSVTMPEPIPARDLPLSDTQRSLLETAGIDVETFIITPEMVVCAQAKLGITRFEEIIAGDAPGFIEGSMLLGCIH